VTDHFLPEAYLGKGQGVGQVSGTRKVCAARGLIGYLHDGIAVQRLHGTRETDCGGTDGLVTLTVTIRCSSCVGHLVVVEAHDNTHGCADLRHCTDNAAEGIFHVFHGHVGEDFHPGRLITTWKLFPRVVGLADLVDTCGQVVLEQVTNCGGQDVSLRAVFSLGACLNHRLERFELVLQRREFGEVPVRLHGLDNPIEDQDTAVELAADVLVQVLVRINVQVLHQGRANLIGDVGVIQGRCVLSVDFLSVPLTRTRAGTSAEAGGVAR